MSISNSGAIDKHLVADSEPNMRRAALWYARRFGWSLFPLRPGTKEPFKGIGVYQATNELAQIETWWQRWPQANIGLHCGGAGLLALDADAYKECYAGSVLLSAADQETVTSLTGGGGAHLLFAMPDDRRFGNATGQLPPGIDVRGWGGYIVLPPSLHPNGRRYVWELDYGPHQTGLIPLPALLYEMLARYTQSGQIEAVHPAQIQQSVALVLRVLATLELPSFGPATYMATGRRWKLGCCPFNPPENPHPEDRSPFVIVFPDGRIVAGCQHNRCRHAIAQSGMTGWRWLRQRAGIGVGAWHTAAIDALIQSLEGVRA